MSGIVGTNINLEGWRIDFKVNGHKCSYRLSGNDASFTYSDSEYGCIGINCVVSYNSGQKLLRLVNQRDLKPLVICSLYSLLSYNIRYKNTDVFLNKIDDKNKSIFDYDKQFKAALSSIYRSIIYTLNRTTIEDIRKIINLCIKLDLFNKQLMNEAYKKFNDNEDIDARLVARHFRS